MEQRKRTLIFVTFFVCTASLGLLTASLATHKWIISRPIRKALNHTTFIFQDDFHNDDTPIDAFADFDTNLPRKFRGRIYFGLFQGTKVLNYGLGDRTAVIWCKFALFFLLFSFVFPFFFLPSSFPLSLSHLCSPSLSVFVRVTLLIESVVSTEQYHRQVYGVYNYTKRERERERERETTV